MKAVADEAVAPVAVGQAGDRRAGGSATATATPWDPTRDRWWDEALATAVAAPAGEPLPDATDPETPYMLIYTSGTTGRPKGAVHVHGGFPIKAAEDLAHTFDLRRGDALFWFTDLGWMMGPWAIAGSLLLGARLVLYEGAPDFPGPDRIWSIAARHRVTHLGVSPTVVRALIPHGTEPVRAHDLPRLRVLGSTGEPWDPESWWWLFREVGRRPDADRQLLRRHGGQRRDRRLQPAHPDPAGVVQRPVPGHGGGRRRTRRRAGPRRRRRAGHPPAAPRP